ncbi:hypothetical protein MSPP1_000233 [Malassezia sp. CBS 17886]|nr:hypothetical protein MSPP1_000233 [Malassezia sp. CBS 17886]
MTCLGTPDYFGSEKLRVIRVVDLPVSHALVIRQGDVGPVDKQLSRITLALGQCDRFLTEHLPRAARVPTRSTADAVTQLLPGGTEAAIASELAAEHFHARVLCRDIQNAAGKSLQHVS